MNSELAIVIPAYKAQFFKETLDSIAAQSCQDFTVYIGDDASPDDLQSIIQPYKSKINLRYERFANNLGGVDLVAHWDRCLALVGTEKWIWLFSDDDLMDMQCVEKFYQQKSGYPNADLFHFDIRIIDKAGATTRTCNPYPEHVDAVGFFARRINFQLNSTVIEYIFKKEAFELVEGFQNFDLAWCADDATWIKLATTTGIRTIPGPLVSWRYSGANISSQIVDKKTVSRKMNSLVNYIKWVESYFALKGLVDITTNFQKLKWIVSLIVVTPAFTLKEKIATTLKIVKQLKYKNVRLPVSLYLVYHKIKSAVNP